MTVAPRKRAASIFLGVFRIAGLKHNIPALVRILDSEEFRSGEVHTGLAADVVRRAAQNV